MTSVVNLMSLAEGTLAVVVHFGDPRLTERCIASIAAGSIRPGLVAVVDNGPQEFPEAPLDALGGASRLIRPGRNLGFAAAVNRAVGECAGFDRGWLINNDAEVEPTAFEELLATTARVGRPALVSSLVMTEDGHAVWFERARFYPWRLESKHVSVPHPVDDCIDPGHPSVLSVPYLPGCSLLVPSELAKGGDLLDGAYFLYGEDVDLAVRAVEAGWPLIVARRSIVRHSSSAGSTPAEKERLLAESGVRLVRRRFPVLLPVSIGFGIAIGGARALVERRGMRVTARMSGYWHELRRSAGAAEHA